MSEAKQSKETENFFKVHPLRDVHITKHALEQFVSRGAKARTEQVLIARIRKNIMRAQEVFKRDATVSLLNNNGKEAKYYLWSCFIYVLTDNSVVTCIKNPKMRHFVKADGSSF